MQKEKKQIFFPEGCCRGTVVMKGKTPDKNTRGKERGGFTLIELLVVVLIIGILAAVALPQYRLTVAKIRVQRMMPLLASFKQAEEKFYLENGSYTPALNSLDLDIPGTSKGQAKTYGSFTFSNGDIVFIKLDRVDYKTYKGNIYLQFVYNNSNTSDQGKIVCVACDSNLTALPHKICQSLKHKK